MRRKKIKNSIKTLMIIAICSIVLLEAAIIGGVVILGGTPKKLDRSNIQILMNTVQSRGKTLQDRLVSWTQMEGYEKSVTDKVKKLAAADNTSVSVFLQNRENRQQLLDEVLENVLQALRESDANSCFIILEGEENSEAKDALYLRDLDPMVDSNDNYDILVEAGNSGLLFEYGMTLDSYWSQVLRMTDDCEYYYAPMQAARDYPEIDALNLGYFSSVYRLWERDLEQFSYTVPLLDENHEPYGVIGYGINCDYLEKMLNSDEIVVDKRAGYYLGISGENGEMTTILSTGDIYPSLFEPGGQVKLLQDDSEFELYEFDTDNHEGRFRAALYPMHLYNTNTPFEHQRWTLCAIAQTKVLYSSSRELLTTMMISIAAALVITVIGAFLLTQLLLRPIRTLSAGLEHLSPAGGGLPRTRISEFDALADAIDQQNIQIFKNASKVSDIIDISGIRLGVIEYSTEQEKIYCTKMVFEMLELPMTGWKENYIDKTIAAELFEQIRNQITPEEGELGIYKRKQPNGNCRWIQLKSVGSRDTGISVLLDVTDNMGEQEKLKHDRDYDVLTNLYNRRAFAREITKILNEQKEIEAVLSLWDLDNLKYTNDTYGHDQGDQYICALARLLKQYEGKNCIVARLSGDEFVLFLYGMPYEEMERQIRKIHLQFMNEKFCMPDGKTLNTSASAGMARYPQDGEDYLALQKSADFAMYQIKRNSKGDVRSFDREDYVRDYILVQGLGELDRILNEDSVNYAFQPIVSMKDKKIFAYEALIRPLSKLLGSPTDLLRVAERQSKMLQIERITWFHALQDFNRQQGAATGAYLFVNSLPDQILSDEELENLEKEFGSLLNHIVMEVTESSRLDIRVDSVKREWCKKNGIQIALDDYGSGYSNNNTLLSGEFDFIKLDMSMVRDIQKLPSVQQLIEGTVAYCHQNEIKVIAEGIEKEEEYQVLLELGVDYGQGYYFARPELHLKTVLDF